MRLEKIVLNGFKSFADKTELVFDSAITAIVGPNGCGKSNVADAVKWVLGEQSVKSLRSGQMADVIFGGSSSRKPMAMAEVSLFLANTTGQLPIETDEVQISRRIYKSGESEYLINNKACRLRDVRELFMDTGVGVKAYSVIEQGQVEQLLTASKTDRRAIFEEAAGISKYKSQKKEALRKLDRTEQNLLRLADIVGEVQKQLRSVKLQAGKARNYLQYSQKLKELQVNYSLVEYHKIYTASAEKKEALGVEQQNFAGVSAEVAKNDALVSELGTQIIETESQVNHADNSLVSVRSKIEQQLQRIEFLRSRITELAERKKIASERIEKLKEQEKILKENSGQHKQELLNCETLHQQKADCVEKLQKTLQDITARCNSLEAYLEDEKSGIIDIVRRTAQLHNELQSISIFRDNLSNQKKRLSDRAQTAKAELENLFVEKAQYQARLDDIEKVLSQLEQSLDVKKEKSEEIDTLITAERQRLAKCKENRSALGSELAVLEDMESRHEGLNNAVKSLLAKNSDDKKRALSSVEALLADIIVADVEYANAVEAALEGKTASVVAADVDELLSELEKIEKLDGRVNFICLDRIEPFADKLDLSLYPSVKARVVEFVKFEGRYAPLVWKLLGKTLIVDSIDSANQLSASLGSEYSFVTLNGEYFGADGTIKFGPLGKTTGLISRKSRILQLRQDIDKVTKEIVALEEKSEKDSQTSEHLSKLRKELRTAIYEANTEKMQVNSKLNVTEQNINRLAQEQPLIAGEIGLLEEQIAQSVQREYNSKQKLEEIEIVNSQRKLRIDELENEYAQKKSEQQSQMTILTDLRVAIGQIAEQSRALKQATSSLENQLQQNLADADIAVTEAKNCEQQCREAQSDILKCEAMVSELFVEKEQMQDSSRELHQKVEKLLERQRFTEQLIRQKRSEQSEIDQKINQLKIELGQLEVKEQGLIERVQEELQLDLKQSYENYENKDVDWESVREEIAELRGKIERLGNVNVDAIEEQEGLEKRNEFLTSQVEDLNHSQNQLQHLINRLNKQSRERFRETFEEIRLHFQQIFRKLFGGGKADILLEDADDILEAGIEIVARPPGKESMSISLLSGGEKTMTAIALLFSVFKAKPSPFCLLDEVDAALDEANNERFNLLIREFQQDSQFIIITHAKRTMSIADVLYGITMQTRGVSKKVSVRFGQYDPEEEAAAVA